MKAVSRVDYRKGQEVLQRLIEQLSRVTSVSQLAPGQLLNDTKQAYRHFCHMEESEDGFSDMREMHDMFKSLGFEEPTKHFTKPDARGHEYGVWLVKCERTGDVDGNHCRLVAKKQLTNGWLEMVFESESSFRLWVQETF